MHILTNDGDVAGNDSPDSGSDIGQPSFTVFVGVAELTALAPSIDLVVSAATVAEPPTVIFSGAGEPP